MQQPDYVEFFHRHADTFSRILTGELDATRLGDSYAESFVAASANGIVQAGHHDERFSEALRDSTEFYRRIGTRRMQVRGVQPQALDDEHDQVRVAFRTDHRRPDGHELGLEFEVTYLLQRREGGPRIFAFVTGDEMALYRAHGLVDDAGRPA